MKKFKDLKVWQRSMDIVVHVYKTTSGLPSAEKFGLTSQINRAVISIPANIAEGSGRSSQKEFRQFLDIALASSFELETLLICVQRLNLLSNEQMQPVLNELEEIQKMLNALIQKVKSNYE